MFVLQPSFFSIQIFSFSSANFLRFLTVLSLYPLSSTFIDITRTDIRFVDRAVIGR